MKKGLFIGSFNPPTKFHIEISKYLIDNHYLDKVIYLPINKGKKDLIDGNHRLKMLQLLKLENNNIEVSDIGLSSNQFNYSMLNKLGDNLYFIIGSDILDNIENFQDYENILKNNYFIVINRNTYNDLEIINNKYYKYKDHFILIDNKYLISSTIIRDNIKTSKKIDTLTSDIVIDYIKKNHLYENTDIKN